MDVFLFCRRCGEVDGQGNSCVEPSNAHIWCLLAATEPDGWNVDICESPTYTVPWETYLSPKSNAEWYVVF